MSRRLAITLLLLTVVALVGVPGALAFPGQTFACNDPVGGCHTLSPSINVTTDITSLTVNPGQVFKVNINWSGGLTSPAGTTEVNWPTDFSNIGIIRDNALFSPTPRVPAPSPAGESGTTTSNLTAPATPGSYIVRVYTSSGSSDTGPDGTNFSDINITVAALSTFSISGFKINNATGAGIPGWAITLDNATTGAEVANTTTDATGFYQFTNLTNGTYSVTEETRAEFIPTGPTSQNVTINGSDVMNVNFTNQPVPVALTFNISGFKINNATGAGIPGWNITLTNDTMQTTTATDANGFYQFTNLTNGSYSVTEETRAEFIPTGLTSVDVAIHGADATNINFTNQPVLTFSISGFKLNGATGAGIKGWLISVENATTGALISSTTTNVTGFYLIPNLTNGNYTVIEETRAGFTPNSPTSQNVTINGADVTDINFTNTPVSGNISGMKFNDSNGNGMRDEGEEGLPDWQIDLNLTDGTIFETTTTDMNGNYSFTNVPPGTYIVQEVLKPGWIQTAPKPVPPGTYNVTIAATSENFTGEDFGNMQIAVSTFNISGFKLNGATGAGIQGWNITLTNDTTQTTTATDANGFYQFTGLANGTYNVTEEMKPGFTNITPTSQPVTINGSDVMDVNFTNQPVPTTFSISGFKLNGATGAGIQGWNITLTNETMQTTTATDANGSYQFTNLTNGTYNVTEETRAGFTPNGPTSQNVTIDGADVANINFTNTPIANGSISGTKFNDSNGNGMRDAGEEGLPDWTIVLTMPDGTTTSTVTDSNGNYSFMNLPAGDYTLSEVLKPGWTQTAPKPVPPGTYTVTITAAGENVTGKDFGNMPVVRPVVGSISGFKINAANGMGLQGWTIRLIGIVGRGTETRVIRMETTTDANGFYTFNNLPAGRYILIEELQRGFVPVGPPVKNIMLVQGENSMNNNFTNRPIRSPIGMEDHRDTE